MGLQHTAHKAEVTDHCGLPAVARCVHSGHSPMSRFRSQFRRHFIIDKLTCALHCQFGGVENGPSPQPGPGAGQFTGGASASYSHWFGGDPSAPMPSTCPDGVIRHAHQACPSALTRSWIAWSFGSPCDTEPSMTVSRSSRYLPRF